MAKRKQTATADVSHIAPVEDKVLCEVAGAHYRVLKVGPHVDSVGVDDIVTFGKASILHTLTPKAPKVFVRAGDICGRVGVALLFLLTVQPTRLVASEFSWGDEPPRAVQVAGLLDWGEVQQLIEDAAVAIIEPAPAWITWRALPPSRKWADGPRAGSALSARETVVAMHTANVGFQKAVAKAVTEQATAIGHGRSGGGAGSGLGGARISYSASFSYGEAASGGRKAGKAEGGGIVRRILGRVFGRGGKGGGMARGGG